MEEVRRRPEMGALVFVPLAEEQIRLLLDRLAPAGGGYSVDPVVGITQAALSIGLELACARRPAL